MPVYIKNKPVCYNEPSPHIFTVGCTNRMTLVTGSGCRSSQNDTVMICFGNSSKTLRPFQRQLNVKCKRNISTKVRLAKTHSPGCQRKYLHLARDSLQSDKLLTRQECVKWWGMSSLPLSAVKVTWIKRLLHSGWRCLAQWILKLQHISTKQMWL